MVWLWMSRVVNTTHLILVPPLIWGLRPAHCSPTRPSMNATGTTGTNATRDGLIRAAELRNLVARMRNPRQWMTTVLATDEAVFGQAAHGRRSPDEYSDLRTVDHARELWQLHKLWPNASRGHCEAGPLLEEFASRHRHELFASS
jgi:hypothetical protein